MVNALGSGRYIGSWFRSETSAGMVSFGSLSNFTYPGLPQYAPAIEYQHCWEGRLLPAMD